MPEKVVELRQLLQILSMFMIVQFFGLLLATQAFSGMTYEQIKSTQIISSSSSALLYIVYIIVFTAILLLVFKIYKGNKLYLLLEAGVVLVSSFFVFLIVIASLTNSVMYNLYGPGNGYVLGIALALSIALVVAKLKMPRLRNVTAIIASVGVGVILGVSFSFIAAFAFMMILAVYDFIAVFITKHMVALGNAAIDRNLSFLVMVDEFKAVPESSIDARSRKEYEKEKKELAKRGGILKDLAHDNMVPVTARTALGTGDLAVPLMLAISAYKVYLSFTLSFVVVLGAMLGLAITMVILAKFKRPLPAIPPLLLGICIALLIYFGFTMV
ncbi:MAG: presenilin family intramembrane aspartyl protease [Candidatus Micrarchaeaceae archaeon]